MNKWNFIPNMLCGTMFYFEQLTKIKNSRGFSKGKEKEGKDEIHRNKERREKLDGLFSSTAENIQTNRFNTAEWMKNTAVNRGKNELWEMINCQAHLRYRLVWEKDGGCRGKETGWGESGVFCNVSVLGELKFPSVSAIINYTIMIIITTVVLGCREH